MNSADHNPNAEFFVTGGTMLPDAPSYVERRADRDLREYLLEGKYCYVLTARQMGKSSLTARTAVKLREAGIGAVIVDLAAIGRNLSIDQWYGSVLSWIGRGIELSEAELEKYWQSQSLLGPVQKWLRALREIILPLYPKQLAVFVDEADYVLDLPFPMDEFFAAIRECYNLRAEDARMRRLTFCLVGVATPFDLIRNKRTTPFNIGQRIELHDFTEIEAAPLAHGLRRERELSLSLLKRIMYWTGGHPFLTQRLCQAVANDGTIRVDSDVDRLCSELFLTRRARETDDNLLFVRESMLHNEEDKAAILDLYAKVRRRKRVTDDSTDPLANTLRLSGITRTQEDCLKVRNRIYERAFDEEWVRDNMPDAELRRQRAAYRRGLFRAGLVAGLILFLVGALAINEVKRQKVARQTAQRILMAAQPQMSRAEIENASAAELENLIRTVAYRNQIKQAQEALGEANAIRVEELLKNYIPKPGQEDLRGFEWYQLWQSSHLESQSLNLENQVAALQFAPDGKQIAIVEIIRRAGNELPRYGFELFNSSDAQKERLFEAQAKGLFNRAVFTPDLRKVLIDSSDNTARLLDVRSGKILASFNGHDQALYTIAISRDGRRVVTADIEGTAQFWEVAREPKSRKLEKQQQRITWVDLSRDGQRVAIASETNVVKVRDFATGRELASLESRESALTVAVFFPDDHRILTAAKDGSIQIWDLHGGKVTSELKGHSGLTTAVAFSTNGAMLATGSDDRTAKLWDAATGRELATIRGHGSTVTAVAWSPDGRRLATGSTDKYVKIWDLDQVTRGSASVEGVREASYLATVFPQKKEDAGPIAIAKTVDGKVKILDVPSGNELSTLDERANDLEFAVFSLDARYVAAGGTGKTVEVWDVGSRKKVAKMSGGENVYMAAFSPNSKQLAFIYDHRTLKIWEMTTRQEVFSREAGTRLSYSIAFSPDGGSVAAACNDGDVILWNLKTGQSLILKGHNGVVRAIAFSPDGSKLATGGRAQKSRGYGSKIGDWTSAYLATIPPAFLCSPATRNRGKPGPTPQLQLRFERIQRLPRKDQEFVIRFLDRVAVKADGGCGVKALLVAA